MIARHLRVAAMAPFAVPVLLAPEGARAQVAAADPPVVTTIAGVVFDSLAARPLAGAAVQLVEAGAGGRARTASSDSTGRYRFDEIPAGTYVLGILHPKLDSLGLEAPLSRVVVRSAEPVRANLAIPSARTLYSTICGRPMGKDSVGLFLGHVRDARGRTAIADAAVTVRWRELLFKRDGMYRETPSVEARTTASGWFAICALPIGSALLVRAGGAADSSGFFEVEIPKSGLFYRDVYVGRGERVMVPIADSAALAGNADTLVAELVRGNGRVRGRVASPVGGPVRGARVAVWGTGAETRAGDDGQFVLPSLPTGTRTLDVRAVGFEPARIPVDVMEEGDGATAVELATVRIGLDTVRVTATRIYSTRDPVLAEFERRRKFWSGHFFDGDRLEERNASVVTDLLRQIPGVAVVPGMAGDSVVMRGGFAVRNLSGVCIPDVFIDGARVLIDGTLPLNSVVSAHEVRAMEVYTRATKVPLEFRSSMRNCGAIVIWTGRRQTTTRPEVAQQGKKR